MFEKKLPKGHNLETKKGEQSFLCASCHSDFILIPVSKGYRPCPRRSLSGKTCKCGSRHRLGGAWEVF